MKDMLDNARDQMRANTTPAEDDGQGDGKVMAEIDGMAADRQEALGSQAPQSKKPLDPVDVKTLEHCLGEAFDTLTDGQIPRPPPGELGPDGRMLPASTYAALKAIEQLAVKAGHKEHLFNADELASSPEGIREAAAIVDNFGRDPKVQRTMRHGGAPDQSADVKPKSGLELPADNTLEPRDLHDYDVGNRRSGTPTNFAAQAREEKRDEKNPERARRQESKSDEKDFEEGNRETYAQQGEKVPKGVKKEVRQGFREQRRK